MCSIRFKLCLLALTAAAAAASALADGMVVQEVFYPKVEIPDQQAFIHFSDGIERLVIQTSFLGQGTNFAWVVPLPFAPEVKPVSAGVFGALEPAFRPQLVHQVRPYYAGMLLFCGLALLGWRCLKDEVSWVRDIPLCLFLAVGASLSGKHIFWGIVVMGLALAARLFSRTPASFALHLLIGTTFVVVLTFVPPLKQLGLIETMGGSDSGAGVAMIPGVTVLSVQRAGVFDATTIRGSDPSAVLQWLRSNGYEISGSAQPAIRDYTARGWVFVAAKVRRASPNLEQTTLHPLAFTFPSRTPVYPTRLTAVNDGPCAIDLYVFGKRRAAARHFKTARCEHVVTNTPSRFTRSAGAFTLANPELLSLVGDSTVGTKLSGRLTPRQMAADVDIRFAPFWRTGATVFSFAGARTIALNVALPLAVLSWLLVGASRGGWNVTDNWVSVWRWRLLALAVGVGLAVYLLLPKVEVVSVRSGESADAVASNPDTASQRRHYPAKLGEPEDRFSLTHAGLSARGAQKRVPISNLR